MIGAFLGLTAVLLAKVPMWVAMIGSMVGAGLLGILGFRRRRSEGAQR